MRIRAFGGKRDIDQIGNRKHNPQYSQSQKTFSWLSLYSSVPFDNVDQPLLLETLVLGFCEVIVFAMLMMC